MSATESRRQVVDFGPSYLNVQPLVVYRRGAGKPEALSDLLHGRVEVLGGSSYVSALDASRAEQPALSWEEIPDVSVEGLVRRVADGQSDYTIVDSNLFDLLKHSIPGVKAAFGLGEETPLAWALRKGPDSSLRDKVSEYFAELESTNELTEIIERYYFHVEDEFDYVGSRRSSGISNRGSRNTRRSFCAQPPKRAWTGACSPRLPTRSPIGIRTRYRPPACEA